MTCPYVQFLSAGWLPSKIDIDSWFEPRLLFAVYGIGFSLLSLAVIGLSVHALKPRDALQSNPLEIHDARGLASRGIDCL